MLLRSSAGAILVSMNLERLRGRMPLVAFILLAVVCLLLFGFACACLTNHPMQVLERMLGSIPTLPPLIEVWSWLALAAVAGAAWLRSMSGGRARAPSPPALQCFLL